MSPWNKYRLAVPVEDVAVNEWVNSQDNVSRSLRLVIRRHVEQFGPGDVFAMSADVAAKDSTDGQEGKLLHLVREQPDDNAR